MPARHLNRPGWLLALSVACLVALPARLRAEEPRPADELLRLLPPGTGATLIVEDLDRHWDEFARSDLAAAIGRLPAVKGWLASPAARQLHVQRAQIRAMFGVDLVAIRDQVLGRAVVLGLVPGADAHPENAHGILLVRLPDRALCERLIDRLNQLELDAGTLAELATREHAGQTYHVRRIARGMKPDESYVILDDAILAWSNSEPEIRALLDRRGRGEHLAAEPRFATARAAMPAGAVATVLIDPDFARRCLGPDPDGAGDPGQQLVRRTLESTRYLAVALTVRDGLTLQSYQSLVGDSGGSPSGRAGLDALVDRLPTTPLVMLAGQLDLSWVFEGAYALIPETDRPRIDDLLTVLAGILLGRDVRQEVLPHLGGGQLAALWRDDSGEPVGLIAVGQDAGPELTRAVANAARTALALVAMDGTRLRPGARPVASQVNGVARGSLSLVPVELAYRLADDLLSLGTSNAMLESLATRPVGSRKRRPEPLRSDRFPGARLLVFADLDGLRTLATERRSDLLRWLGRDPETDEATAARDLEQVLALSGLFGSAYAAFEVETNPPAWRQTIGLSVPTPVGR